MRSDVRHNRPLDHRRGIMPAHRRAGWMLRGVPPVTGQGGQIDTSDKSDPTVDHDRLLVMAMKRPLSLVKHTPHTHPGELVAHRPRHPPRWLEHRTGAPAHNSTRTSTRRAASAKQISHHHRMRLTVHHEVRRQKPATQIHR